MVSPTTNPPVEVLEIDRTIDAAIARLLSLQSGSDYWWAELE